MPYDIRVDFEGGLTQGQIAVFEEAAARWGEIISADVPGVLVNGI